MAEIITYTFASEFADRVVSHVRKLPSSKIKNRPNWFETIWGQFEICHDNEHATKRIRKSFDGYPSARLISEDEFHYAARRGGLIDWSKIEVGKSIHIDELAQWQPSVRWGELRAWMEDNLTGTISVFLGQSYKHISFSEESDYILFRLQWL